MTGAVDSTVYEFLFATVTVMILSTRYTCIIFFIDNGKNIKARYLFLTCARCKFEDSVIVSYLLISSVYIVLSV